jgi:hypothetical protein
MKMMILASSLFLSQLANATIENYTDISPVSEACTWKILKAIDAEDGASENRAIGDNASASFADEVLPTADKNGEYVLGVTVNEEDQFAGYSTWEVVLANPNSSCDVRKVTLEDIAH